MGWFTQRYCLVVTRMAQRCLGIYKGRWNKPANVDSKVS
ncbi:hypothetical protein SS1G_10871 [Sclerotinia sclerotiorum 1980 UF-70]|uniref:Uncharacterized protein n=1 Tax=Sclerotinia sclerotiorum (strain ATCC 18683 / 1980 / Ss-1) TaxID=665079 RepID=A7EZV4_SCLS1|nr:hypothetical protein SS1G_10871 [Sclerotinia sclerotiorum 1980 UF-70]EDN94996.1 hypothetical protein SS1G_10871 [Sclerotinia sclerotiorum 1980 UF-70]